MKTQLLIIVLTLIFQVGYGQKFGSKKRAKERFVKDSIQGIYIPKNLEDCYVQIDSFWDDSTKTIVKNWTEEEFGANAHFGFGMWIRNNWQLWSGSKLSMYFNELGIYHPDDMSGIILDSYHRRLTGQEVKLDDQIGYYKTYWEVNKEPTKDQYPKGEKKLKFETKMSYTLKDGNFPGICHVQTNSKSDKIWIYDYHFGWLQIFFEELKELDNPEKREETLVKLFGRK